MWAKQTPVWMNSPSDWKGGKSHLSSPFHGSPVFLRASQCKKKEKNRLRSHLEEEWESPRSRCMRDRCDGMHAWKKGGCSNLVRLSLHAFILFFPLPLTPGHGSLEIAQACLLASLYSRSPEVREGKGQNSSLWMSFVTCHGPRFLLSLSCPER